MQERLHCQAELKVNSLKLILYQIFCLALELLRLEETTINQGWGRSRHLQQVNASSTESRNLSKFGSEMDHVHLAGILVSHNLQNLNLGESPCWYLALHQWPDTLSYFTLVVVVSQNRLIFISWELWPHWRRQKASWGHSENHVWPEYVLLHHSQWEV